MHGFSQQCSDASTVRFEVVPAWPLRPVVLIVEQRTVKISRKTAMGVVCGRSRNRSPPFFGKFGVWWTVSAETKRNDPHRARRGVLSSVGSPCSFDNSSRKSASGFKKWLHGNAKKFPHFLCVCAECFFFYLCAMREKSGNYFRSDREKKKNDSGRLMKDVGVRCVSFMGAPSILIRLSEERGTHCSRSFCGFAPI